MRKGLSTSEAGKLGAIASAATCQANKQKRIDTWNANPKCCKFCNKPISYQDRKNDFCNQSCAAAFNNKGVRRHGEPPHPCAKCGNDTRNPKFCSNQCQKDFEWSIKKSELIISGVDNSINHKSAKRYLIELHNGCCQICNLSEWQGQPMPLVLDHISGNPYDNTLQNLRVICHNCNAQTPTFAGRNKGNGRFERAKRYQLEKEVFDKIK